MRQSLRTFTALLTVTLTVAACSRESYDRKTHDPKSEFTEGQPSTTTAPSGEVKLSEADFVSAWSMALSENKLEALLRNPTAPARADLYKMSDEASKRTAAMAPGDSRRAALLRPFRTALLAGCAQDQNGELKGCRYNSLLRGNPSTVGLAIAAADDSASDLEQRYRLLALASTLVGQLNDSRVSIAYLKTAKAFQDTLEVKGDSGSSVRLKKHRELTEQALQSLKADQLTLVERKNLETTFDIWNLSRARRQEDRTRDEALFRISIGGLFADNQLQKLTDATANLPESTSTKMQALLSNRPNMAKNLGISDGSKHDIHSFLFDNLWLGRLTLTEAQIVWEAYGAQSKQTPMALRQQAQIELLNIAKTRMILSAQSANKIIINAFKAKGQFVIDDAVRHAINESMKGQTEWADTSRRLGILRAFNDQNLRTADLTAPESKALDSFFANIDKNIKIFSNYPSMLVMCYQLAKMNFTMRLLTWTGLLEVKGAQILEWYFNGELNPWLPFGQDRAPLAKSEIPLVFNFVLETGILEEAGIELSSLFKLMGDQMTGPIRTEVEKIDDAFRQAYELDPNIGSFTNLCAEEREKKKQGSGLHASPSMTLEMLQNYALVGTPQMIPIQLGLRMNPGLNSAWSFFENERRFTRKSLEENLEVFRLGYTPKVELIKLYAKLAKEYLERSTRDRGTTASTIASIDQAIEPLEKLRNTFYSRVFRLVNHISPCGELLIRAELDSQRHVLRGLIAFFSRVHAAITSARGKAHALDTKTFGFAGKYNIAGLQEHEASFGFDENAFHMSRVQALLLLKEILEKGFNASTGFAKPVRELGSIQIPTKLRDFDEAWRQNSFRLDWFENADEFVNFGIQRIFDEKLGFMNWTQMHTVVTSSRARIGGLAALIKTGPVLTDKGIQQLEIKELVRANLEMEKWIELDAEWSRVLKATGQSSRIHFDNWGAEGYVYEANNQSWRGLLEFSYEKISADRLGEVDDDQSNGRPGPIAEFKQHVRTVRSLGQATFKSNDVVLTELTKYYSDRVDLQLNLAATMADEAKRLELARQSRPDIFPSWRVSTNRPVPAVPLLPDLAVRDLKARIGELSRQTGYQAPMRFLEATPK